MEDPKIKRLQTTVTALEVLVALLAKQAKAANPNFEAETMRMLVNPATADGQFDQSAKDAIRRLLSA